MTNFDTSAPTRKPRARKDATPAPLVYKRPSQKHEQKTAATQEQRLANLQAAFAQADEKLEMAYDAAERGSPADVLLDHIAHDLLCDAMHPVLRNEDEADLGVSIGDAEKAREALFKVLAALEGVMALSLGSVIYATLADAFILLDWAQDELEDLSLHRLLPDAGGDTAMAFARGRDLAIELMEEAYARRDDGALQDARECMRWMREGKAQDSFVAGYLNEVIKDRSLIAGFSAVLSAVLDNDGCSLDNLRSITLAETQAGTVGANGTQPYPPYFHGAEQEPETVPADLEQMLDDASGHYGHALAVVRAACNDQQKSDLVWAAERLMEHEDAPLNEALRGADKDALECMSAALATILGLLSAAAHTTEGNDEALMWAAHNLTGQAKECVDKRLALDIQKLVSAIGAASEETDA